MPLSSSSHRAAADLWDFGTSALGVVEAFATFGRVSDVLDPMSMALRRAASKVDRVVGLLGGPRLHEVLSEPGGPTPCVLVAQQHLCVLWKPAGWTTTVGSKDRLLDAIGNDEDAWPDEVDGHRLGKPLQDWVKKVFGAEHPISTNPTFAYGLAHRLDRETSGLLVCARSYTGFYNAQLQFVARRVTKEYVCLCHRHLRRVDEPVSTNGALQESPWLIDVPLRVVLERGYDGMGRTLRSIVDHTGGVRASTEILAVSKLLSFEGAPISLVEIRLRTGRLHQIRAHLSHLGHPLVGDAAYRGPFAWPRWCPRLFLHEHRIALDVDGETLTADAPLPGDLRILLAQFECVGDLQVLRRCWSLVLRLADDMAPNGSRSLEPLEKGFEGLLSSVFGAFHCVTYEVLKDF